MKKNIKKKCSHPEQAILFKNPKNYEENRGYCIKCLNLVERENYYVYRKDKQVSDLGFGTCFFIAWLLAIFTFWIINITLLDLSIMDEKNTVILYIVTVVFYLGVPLLTPRKYKEIKKTKQKWRKK